MKYARIVGTGGYLPATVFTNADWEKRVDTSDAWIVERTGIRSRHIASPHESTAYMSTCAAKAALAQSLLLPQAVQLLIVATTTPDKVFPSTASLVQKQLGIPCCIAFDMQAACTGFIYALSVAEQYIKTGVVKNALVIGAERMSTLLDWTDRNTCVLFGDGAGAVVLQADQRPGILSTHLYAQPCEDELLYVDQHLKMQGRKVFKIAVNKLGEMVQDIQRVHHLTAEQIDWLVPHQANIRIIEATAQKLGLPMEKVICTVQTHSNTSSASIPLALDVAVRDGRIQEGQHILLEAFGAGLTWGSAFIKY